MDGDEFRFKGGGKNKKPNDPFWSWNDDHAVLISDGNCAVLHVARDLSGVCGKTITVVVEIEEEDNSDNNDTLTFQVRVEE